MKLSFQETEFFSSIKEKHSCVSFSPLFPPGLPEELLPALCQYNCLHSWRGSWAGRSWETTLTAQQKNCCFLRNFGDVSQPTAAQTHFPAEPKEEWAPLQPRSGNDHWDAGGNGHIFPWDCYQSLGPLKPHLEMQLQRHPGSSKVLLKKRNLTLPFPSKPPAHPTPHSKFCSLAAACSRSSVTWQNSLNLQRSIWKNTCKGLRQVRVSPWSVDSRGTRAGRGQGRKTPF